MKSFEWVSPTSIADALKVLQPGSKMDPDEAPQPMAGGQDLLTAMKDYIVRPQRVVNLKSVPGLDKILFGEKSVKIGALVTLVAIEEHPEILKRFPGLSEAAHSIATLQIRNLATVGGNLCQRPRCWYFRLENVICLKKGGNECYAESGENKYHAIFGGGPSFIVHPSDLAPMLVALEAKVTVASPKGQRVLPLEKFFVLPADEVRRENVLEPGEIVVEIEVPFSRFASRSTYLKFKERPSHDFATVSAAAAVDAVSGGRIGEARIVMGGVAPIPWRVPKAESYLAGKAADPKVFAEAARIAMEGAQPLAKNGYKIPLAQTIVRRALARAVTLSS